MKIQLERENELFAIAYGYVQEEVGSKFTPIAIALGKESILIYNDLHCDRATEQSFYYEVKKEIPYKTVRKITKQTFKGQDYSGFARLIITLKEDIARPFIICYRAEDKRQMNKLFDALSMQTKVNTKERKFKKKSVFKDIEKK